MGHTIEFLVRHGYLLLFIWILGEQAVLPLPSVPLLLAAGALSRTGKLDLTLILFYGLAACLLADNVWFQLGRRRGPKVLKFICRVALEPDSCVRKTENAFVRYGMRSLLVAKFVPGLNAVAAPLAGSSGASLGRFLLFDSVGALLWIFSYTGLGFLFGDQLEIIARYALRLGSGLGVLLVVLLVVWVAWKIWQRHGFLRKLAIARITAEELWAKLRAGEDVLVVDVRGHLDIETHQIPGVIRIPMEDLAVRHEAIPRDRDIVLFCS